MLICDDTRQFIIATIDDMQTRLSDDKPVCARLQLTNDWLKLWIGYQYWDMVFHLERPVEGMLATSELNIFAFTAEHIADALIVDIEKRI
ncbi:hypothetical protein DX883_08020 [Vibrio fluvialis]|nr:hypothetical protein [Vibrio fluvialis]MBY8055933.1 hypothetical protein [Vibrio fluvialis]